MRRTALPLLALAPAALGQACAGAGPRPPTGEGCPATPLAPGAPPDANTARLTTTWYTDGTLWAGPVPPYHGRWFAGPAGMKVGWWRTTRGKLTITGRRLDAPAPPLRATIPDGYGETGFQATGLTFPTEGCWELVARVGTTHTFRLVAEVHPASAHPLATPPGPR